jgi:hypothetical protein
MVGVALTRKTGCRWTEVARGVVGVAHRTAGTTRARGLGQALLLIDSGPFSDG